MVAMKNRIIALATVMVSICACQSNPPKQAPAEVAGHVIVIGLDGWGTWSFEKGDTPFIREKMQEGSTSGRCFRPSAAPTGRR